MRYFYFILFAAILLCIQSGSQTPGKVGDKEENNVLTTRQCIAFGGVGVVHKDLDIDLISAKNELGLSAGKEWTGLEAQKNEVVIVYEDNVWSSQNLPKGFDLSKAAIISFEIDKVRFYNFADMSGGYYKRRKNA